MICTHYTVLYLIVYILYCTVCLITECLIHRTTDSMTTCPYSRTYALTAPPFQVRGAFTAALKSLRTALRALDRILSAHPFVSTFSPSWSQEDLKTVENILKVFFQNFRRCKLKYKMQVCRLPDSPDIVEDFGSDYLGFALSLPTIVSLFEIQKLTSLSGTPCSPFLTLSS